MTSAFSWQNSISFCPASFCTPRPNLPVTPGVSSYFCIPVPYNEKDIFLGCQLQKVLQVFIEPSNFSFFSIIGWGIDLVYSNIEWFALETNRDHFVVFEIAVFQLFVDYDGYSISFKGFLPRVVDIMSSELNSPIPVHFSSLIPRMLMFTLAISCLTTSNLP